MYVYIYIYIYTSYIYIYIYIYRERERDTQNNTHTSACVCVDVYVYVYIYIYIYICKYTYVHMLAVCRCWSMSVKLCQTWGSPGFWRALEKLSKRIGIKSDHSSAYIKPLWSIPFHFCKFSPSRKHDHIHNKNHNPLKGLIWLWPLSSSSSAQLLAYPWEEPSGQISMAFWAYRNSFNQTYKAMSQIVFRVSASAFRELGNICNPNTSKFTWVHHGCPETGGPGHRRLWTKEGLDTGMQVPGYIRSPSITRDTQIRALLVKAAWLSQI